MKKLQCDTLDDLKIINIIFNNNAGLTKNNPLPNEIENNTYLFNYDDIEVIFAEDDIVKILCVLLDYNLDYLFDQIISHVNNSNDHQMNGYMYEYMLFTVLNFNKNISLNLSDNYSNTDFNIYNTTSHNVIKFNRIKKLINHPKINIEKFNDIVGGTPLHVAIKNNYGEKNIIEYLINHPKNNINYIYKKNMCEPLLEHPSDKHIIHIVPKEYQQLILSHPKFDKNNIA